MNIHNNNKKTGRINIFEFQPIKFVDIELSKTDFYYYGSSIELWGVKNNELKASSRPFSKLDFDCISRDHIQYSN